MNKKTIIGASVAVVLVVIVGIVYFLSGISNAGTSDQLNNQVPNQLSSDRNALVAYFSLPETDQAENMTTDQANSTVVVDGQVLGNTQYVAMLIQEATNADLFRIEPVTPYTLDHDALTDQALEEQQTDARPEIQNLPDSIDQYDTIFIGYPIWWGDMPQILYTFLEAYDFSGKTVIPFSTHGGSGLAGTVSTIRNRLSGANVITNAFTLSRNSMEDAPEKVGTWLEEINMA